MTSPGLRPNRSLINCETGTNTDAVRCDPASKTSVLEKRLRIYTKFQSDMNKKFWCWKMAQGLKVLVSPTEDPMPFTYNHKEISKHL